MPELQDRAFLWGVIANPDNVVTKSDEETTGNPAISLLIQ